MAAGEHRMRAALIANLRVSPVESAILLLGLAVLIFLVVRLLSGGAASADAATTPPIAVVPTDAAPAATALSRRAPRPMTAQTLLRDPFKLEWLRPGAAPSADDDGKKLPQEQLVLQFTLTGDDGQSDVAVISGVVVERGSVLGGYVVEEIGRRYAVLRGPRDTIQLNME